MCDWLLANLGPDYPLHFSRFHPEHKLTHLPPTPVEILQQAREIAQRAGLHYVYIGNCPEVADGEYTYCPKCKKLIIERSHFAVLANELEAGKCRFCSTPIAGVWC
jgi:pyruvate formate lyase activating enzyme